jgi:hypothetical protein
MMQMVHSRFNALLSACVLSLIATAGWSQSLTWLGTLGGNYSVANGVFPPTAPWWSARLTTPQGSGVPFAGRMVSCKTSARWAAFLAWLLVFPPTAPWWSAGLTTPQGSSCLSLDGVRWDARPRHAGRRLSGAYGVSADGVWWSARLSTPQGSLVPFAGRMVSCKTSARWAAVRAMLMVFPPTAPWWSAGLKTPQGSLVPFAGRRRVGCKTSARWGGDGAGLMVFPPTAPWWSAGLTTPQGRACLSLDGVGWDARPRHAGRRLELGSCCFRRRRRGGRHGWQGSVPFAGRRRAAWKT